MKTTKEQDKQDIDVYGTLLMERAVISDVVEEEVRGAQHFMFTIFDTKYPMAVECVGRKQLALVLSAMWSSYMRARNELGVEQYIQYG